MLVPEQNAARLFKVVQVSEARQLRLQSLRNPHQFIELAEKQGYRFTLEHLLTEMAKLSDETIASIWNPGVGPRRHLVRR